jgi:hypothetical protein
VSIIMADTVTTPVIGGGALDETTPGAMLPQASPVATSEAVTPPPQPTGEVLTRRGQQGRIDGSVGASPQGATLQLMYTTPQRETLYEDGASRAQTLQFGGGYGQNEGPILTFGLNNSSVVPVDSSPDKPQTRTDSTQAGLRLSLDGPGVYAERKSILTGDGGEERSNSIGGVLSFNPSFFYSNTTAATNPDGRTVLSQGATANKQQFGLSLGLTGPGVIFGGVLDQEENQFYSIGINSRGIPDNGSRGVIGNVLEVLPSPLTLTRVNAPDHYTAQFSYPVFDENGQVVRIATNGGLTDQSTTFKLLFGIVPVVYTSGQRVGDVVLSDANKQLVEVYNQYVAPEQERLGDFLLNIAAVFPPEQWPTLLNNPAAVPPEILSAIPGSASVDPEGMVTPDQLVELLMPQVEALYRESLPEAFATPEVEQENLSQLRALVLEAAPYIVRPVVLEPAQAIAQEGNRVTPYSTLDHKYVLDGGLSYSIVERDGITYLEVVPVLTAQATETADLDSYQDGLNRSSARPVYHRVGPVTSLRGEPVAFPVEAGMSLADAQKFVLNDPEQAAVIQRLLSVRQEAVEELSRLLHTSINMNQVVVNTAAKGDELADSTQFNHALAAFLARDPSAIDLGLRRYIPA